jgi:SNF2 family DNA or RNA helicase
MLLYRGMGQHTLWTMWRDMPAAMRESSVIRFEESELASKEECSILRRCVKTRCLPILQRIHKAKPSAFPVRFLMDADAEASATVFLKKLPYTCLVADEASRCIDPRAKRSEAVEDLAGKVANRYLLSGTLCVGRPTDLFMPFRIMERSILGGSWTSFKSTYCETAAKAPNIIIGYKNLDHLKLRIDPYILGMKRSECLDLPERTFTERYYEPQQEMKELYNDIVSQDSVTVAGKTIDTSLVITKHNKLRQVLSGFIMPSVDRSGICDSCDKVALCVANDTQPGQRGCIDPNARKPKPPDPIPLDGRKLSMLEEDLADSIDEKVIIWAWYRYDLALIADMLRRKKIPYIAADEKDCAHRFETSPDIRVFLGQQKQGIGITLNSATCTIYYSHGLDLESRLQSLDRNLRIGQRNSVLVKDYICQGSIEGAIVWLLRHKSDVRDFMQHSADCMLCVNFMDCAKNGVRAYTQGCAYYGERKNAERKRVIKLHTLE